MYIKHWFFKATRVQVYQIYNLVSVVHNSSL